MKNIILLFALLLLSFIKANSQYKDINDKILHEKVDSMDLDYNLLSSKNEVNFNRIMIYILFKNAYAITSQNTLHFKQLVVKQDSNLVNFYEKIISNTYDTFIKRNGKKFLSNFTLKEQELLRYRINYFGRFTEKLTKANKVSDEELEKKLFASEMALNEDKKYIKLLSNVPDKTNILKFYSSKYDSEKRIIFANENAFYFKVLKDMAFSENYMFEFQSQMKTNRYLDRLAYFNEQNNIEKLNEKFENFLQFKQQFENYEKDKKNNGIQLSEPTYFRLNDGSIKLKYYLEKHYSKKSYLIGTIEMILAGYEIKPMILSFKYIENKQGQINAKTNENITGPLPPTMAPPPPPPLPPGYKPKPMEW